MMASVSLAGMSCRRADAAPDTLQSYMQSHDRFAGTRRTNLITTHAPAAQCLYDNSQKNHAVIPQKRILETRMECGSSAAALPDEYTTPYLSRPNIVQR